MVKIDNVYQKVLAIANKEQRGYITPQEFNLFADHAQIDIFEQYVYDINQFKRGPGNDSKYSDMVNLIEEKLTPFYSSQSVAHGTTLDTLTDLYQIGEVWSYPQGYVSGDWLNASCVVEEINVNDLIKTQNSPLLKATTKRPVYYLQGNAIYFIPADPISGYTYHAIFLRNPKKPNWTYINASGAAMYNPTAADHQNFQLHKSEENNLVIKILQLAGIGIKDPGLYQIAGAEDNKNIQQEKQ